MSETVQLTPELASQAPNVLPLDFEVHQQEVQRSVETQASVDAFSSSLESVAQKIPEAEQDKEAIAAAGAELIEAFGIKPELFNSEYRSIIFTSISARLASLNTGDPSPKDRQEKEFIADATLLLSKNFTDEYQDVRDSLEAEDNSNHLTEAGREAIYDTYTDVEHSKAITEAINAGLLDEVKAAMGITDENETPYRIRVLSIATENGGDLNGLSLKYPDQPENWKDMSREEQVKINRENSTYLEAGKAWQKGLLERGEEMRAALGNDSASPAWVTDINGEKQLCISLPLAEKILYKDELTGSDAYYDGNDYIRDLAILKHEYVHTQPGLTDPELGLDFGISIEERRAEYFSGDRHGYTDVKQFMQDIALLTGVTVQDRFELASQKGRDPAELMQDFAATLGLKNIVELLTVVPKNYAQEQSNAVRKSMHEYIGGYDGFLQKIYNEKIAQGQAEAIQERIKGRVAMLLKANYEFWTPAQYRSFREFIAGTSFLSDELEQEFTNQRKQAYKDKLRTINFK